MRYLPRYTFFFLFVTLILFPQGSVFAASENIILSEIHITGGAGHSDDDFVELYNPGSKAIDISDFRLRYKNSKGTEGSIRVFSSGSCIPPQGYFLWANSKGIFSPLADTVTGTALSNDYSVLIYPPEGTNPLDMISFGTGTTLPNPGANQSLVQNPATHSWSLNTTLTPTKSTPCPEPTPPAPPTITNVRLNELLPAPGKTDAAGEFIELYNDSDIEADISGFSLHDASQNGEYVFPLETKIAPHDYFVLAGSISKIALNNSNETLSFFDNTHALIDSVSYKTGREGVSLNFTKAGWRGGIPTPGTINQPNELPEIRERVPKKGYSGMPVTFDARGRDAEGSALKYTWDFGDGHKSYKEETEHTYEENGTYQVALTVSDGKDDVVETFSLKIESFPKLEIRITALVPNPDGKDSDNEWLLIENREKETIDLEGFSIATGWDKLVNHPIRKSFAIKGKSTAKLTRDFAAFTLPNTKGRIELRSPNGKTLQEIEYKEKQSIEEDLIYRKEKGKRWEWQKEEVSASQPELETITASEETVADVTETAPEIKSADPQISRAETLDKETLRREFYRLLHHHAWVDISHTSPSPQTNSTNNFKNLFTQANILLNNWQSQK